MPYTGPVKQEPRYPQSAMRFDKQGNIISQPCSRKDFLEDRDAERKFAAESDRCFKRRHKSGFEKLDNMRYGG